MAEKYLIALLLTVAHALASSDLGRARELYQRTRYGEALVALDAGSSNNPAVLLLAGQAAFLSGDLKSASAYLEKAVAADPDNSEAHHWLGKAYGRRAETASFLSAPGLASKCRRSFERAVAVAAAPGNVEAMADLLEYYLEAPGFLGGGRDKAAAMAKRIAEADRAEGEFAWAKIAEKDRNAAEAGKHWRRAQQIEPEKPSRMVDLARFLARQGRLAESDEWFAKAMAAGPAHPAVWFARAEVLIETRRNMAEARRLLERYIASEELTPGDPPRGAARKLLERVHKAAAAVELGRETEAMSGTPKGQAKQARPPRLLASRVPRPASWKFLANRHRAGRPHAKKEFAASAPLRRRVLRTIGE